MNKSFLQFIACMLMTVCAVTSIQAQDYAYFTDFSNGIPDEIILYDVDGLIPPAGQILDGQTDPLPDLSDFEAAWIPRNYTDVEGSPVAVSISWYVPAGQADDWMVLPGLDISLGQKLVWKAGTVNAMFADGYEVVVSTVSSDIEDMQAGTVVYSVEEEETIDFSSGTGLLYEREVDLDEWIGETIYIGFRNNSDDKYLLIIDDIGVLNAPMGIDAALATFSIPLEYGWTPLFQAQPIGPFEASVLSFSNVDLSDARVIVHIDSVDVDGNFNTVWTGESSQSDLSPLSTGAYEIDETWMPEVAGLYVLYYEVLHDDSASEIDVDNDFSEAYYFFITELDYGKNASFMNTDPPLVSDFQSFFFTSDPTDDAGNTTDASFTGEYGQVLEFVGYSQIDSIGMQIQDADGDIAVNVYEFDPSDDTIGELLSTTMYTDGAEGNAYVTVPLETPLSLAPGHYFVSATDPANGSLRIIACNYYRTDNRTFFREDSEEWLQFAWVPIMEVYLTEQAGPATSASLNFDPNSLTVDFMGMANGFVESWAWDFGDGTTSTDQSPVHVYDMAGTYAVTLTVTLPDGTEIIETADVTVSCLLSVEVDEVTPTGATAEFVQTGAEPYTYNWANADGDIVATTTEPTVDGLEFETMYVLTVEDADGCSTTADFTTTGCNLSIGDPVVEEQTVFFNNTVSGEPSVFNWTQAILDANTSNGIDAPIANNVPIGTYTILIEDEFGCSDEVSFEVIELTGIEDIAVINEMAVYPNPATDVLMVKLDLKEATDVQIGLYDIAGKLVIENKVSNTAALTQSLDIADVANGVYMIRVTLGSDTVTHRVVIGK